jgi:ABC-type hemin transport system ATPase subunit
MARVLVQVAGDGVMVLDEPFAAQDPGEVERLIRLVRSRAAEGRAVVAAVHDASIAHAIADDVLLLDGGRRVFAGDAAVGLQPARLGSLFGIDFVNGPVGPTPRFGGTLA